MKKILKKQNNKEYTSYYGETSEYSYIEGSETAKAATAWIICVTLGLVIQVLTPVYMSCNDS